MNSQIDKKPKTEIIFPPDMVKIASGSFFYRKLLSWCETEPSILIWEITCDTMPVPPGITDKKVAETYIPDWRIEFQMVRANSAKDNGFFDGVAIIAGSIKNTLEMVNEQSQTAYLLKVNSRSLRGERTFLSAVDLWTAFIGLGLIKSKG